MLSFYLKFHCKFNKLSSKYSADRMMSQFDKICGNGRKEEDDSQDQSPDQPTRKTKWRRPRGLKKTTCPKEGCFWSDDLSRIEKKACKQITDKHKNCILSVTFGNNFATVGPQPITLLPGMSSRIICKAGNGELLEGR